MRPFVLYLGVCLLAAAVLAGSRSGALGLVAVALGWVGVLAAGKGSDGDVGRYQERERWSARETLVLALLVGLSLFLRVWRLNELPPALWSDEAQHGLDALRVLREHDFPVYFPANCGQEPLYKYLVAGSLSLVRDRVVAVRLPAALSGVLLVLMAYVFARRLVGRRYAALVGLLVSFSCWPVHFSRIAFRASLGPPIAAASLAVLLAGRTRRHAVASGLLAAATLYTYPAFRLFPLIPFAWLIADPAPVSRGRRRASRIVLWVGAVLTGAVPLLALAVARPDVLAARMEMASLFSEARRPVGALLRNVMRHMEMFTFEGDHNPRHNVPGLPMLFPLTGLLFLVGIPAMVVRRRRAALLLLGWLLTMLVPGILSVERQAPHCLRSLGVLPVPYIFAAYALYLLGRRPSGRVVVAAALLAAGVGDAIRYWERWPRELATLDPRRRSLYSFNEDEAALARWLTNREDSRPVNLSAQLYLHPTVAYLAPSRAHGHRLLRHPDELGWGPAILCPFERNLWWIRDDRRKRFFDWWYATGLVSEGEVWEAVIRTYPRPCDLGVASDSAMMRSLAHRFPDLRLSSLGVFVCAETDSAALPPAPGFVMFPCVEDLASGVCGTGWIRVPPGELRVSTEDGTIRVALREWCVGPETELRSEDNHLAINVVWPTEARFMMEGGSASAAALELQYLGPPRDSESGPLSARLRRLKARLLR